MRHVNLALQSYCDTIQAINNLSNAHQEYIDIELDFKEEELSLQIQKAQLCVYLNDGTATEFSISEMATQTQLKEDNIIHFIVIHALLNNNMDAIFSKFTNAPNSDYFELGNNAKDWHLNPKTRTLTIFSGDKPKYEIPASDLIDIIYRAASQNTDINKTSPLAQLATILIN